MTDSKRIAGALLGLAIIAAAAFAILAVAREVRKNPRTDDAEVFANLIGIAPEVSGRIVAIQVKDNQLVRKGDPLFEIDPLPYEYALETARSQQATLEAQIRDLERSIGAQNSGVISARANTNSTQARVTGSDAAIEAARASVDAAKAEVARAEADLSYAESNLKRLEPLLTKQFVTVDQVDQARTAQAVRSEAVRQARSRLALAEAQLSGAVAQKKEAEAVLEQSKAQLDQSVKNVAIPDPLIAQRQAREAAVKNAQYDLERCKVYAPFDARVTNLTISEGAWAHAGQQAFTLIDARNWWVVANFRETDLRNIRAGMKADVSVMTQPDRRFEGTVESVGFGVTPDPAVIGQAQASPQGLPDIQRSLNWVHLAARFPVRIRVNATSPDDFRIGASALVTMRGAPREAAR